ncbi:UNVERIFIED_CONTAM: hypothetical protein GTU68_036385 [Idotea baltica]|nr:hypothetical protein [Idotea baltica]
MLSDRMEAALNAQIKMEAYASFLYLSMASWCDGQGMEGTSQFFFRQSAEENDHMMRIFKYILELDGRAIVPDVDKPPHEFESIRVLFNEVYAHEQKVTKAINHLVDLANEETDHSTHNFLQWYVTEQREEESLIRSILDKVKLIGEGPRCLYFIDKELEEINNATLAQSGDE